MKHSTWYMALVILCLLLSLPALEHPACAVVSTGLRGSGREAVNCYFSAFRMDWQIMVYLTPGSAVRLYRLTKATTIRSNGVSVGRQYLRDGVPIILLLNSKKIVDEILIR